VSGREVRTYFWLMCCLASRADVSSPRRPTRRSAPGVFHGEGPSDTQVSLRKDEVKRGDIG